MFLASGTDIGKKRSENQDRVFTQFIDDNISNIEVLKNTKIKGILYKNNEELFHLLNKYI